MLNKFKHNLKLDTAKQYVIPETRSDGDSLQLDVIINHFSKDPVRFYPGRHEQFKKELAEHYGCDKDHLILTAGSDMALKTIVDCFVVPDSVVFMLIPTYPHFESFIEMSPATNIIKAYAVTEEEMVKTLEEGLLLHHPDLVYLVNPNIPTGISYDLDESMFEDNPSVMFVVDEAYVEFSKRPSLVRLVKKYDNLIVTRTFSKAYGIAGARLGCIISKIAPALLPAVNDKSVTDYSIQKATEAMKRGVGNDVDIAKDETKIFFSQDQNKYFDEISVRELDEIHQIQHIEADIACANFFSIKTPTREDTQKLCQAFEKKNIYVRDKSSDYRRTQGTIRICYADPIGMNRVFDVLKKSTLISQLKVYPSIIDIDGTLREGAKGPIVWHPDVETLVRSVGPGSIILSNNPQIKETQLFGRPIYNSLNMTLSMLKNCSVWRVSDPIPDEDVKFVILDTANISYEKICHICLLNVTTYYIDSGLTTTPKLAVEFDEKDDSEYIIPDIGMYVEMLRALGVACIDSSKASAQFDKSFNFVIGDSDSDRMIAKKINGTFIRFDSHKDIHILAKLLTL